MKIDLAVKLLFTLFVAILVPIYWALYGPQNFLWLSDVGLFLTLAALWLNSSMLMSMAIVGVFPLEFLWNVDFFTELFTGRTIIGLAAYMFNPDLPLYLRGLSLFHVAMPIIWIRYLILWGYDTRAFKYMTSLLWIILPATYFLTDPYRKINWVFIPEMHQWNWMPPLASLVILMIGFPLIFFLPTHMLVKRWFIHRKAPGDAQ